MRISIIVAMSENRVIGVDNRLPWRLPADLRHFRHTTLGKPVVMGRRTFESIGRPLDGRENLVVSRDPTFHAPGCTKVSSLDEAIANLSGHDEIMIIGGASIYTQILPRTQRIYLTLVHAHINGDVVFPVLDDQEWRTTAREDHGADDKNPYDYSFLTLERGAATNG
jgi:dihydrofolate reductase